MIIAIERNKFTYLYKYNQVSIDFNQVIDLSIEQLKISLKSKFDFVVNELNRILPIFEQDHEVLLLEIDKSKISIEGKFVVHFNAVISIYPLSNIGSQLLSGKINENFIVNQPIFEIAVEEVKIKRSVENRNIASNNLLTFFSLTNFIDERIVRQLSNTVEKLLIDKKTPQNLNTYLDYLLSYNKTPSYMPDGHVEYLCKIGAVAMKYYGKSEDTFTNGPFYKSCLKHRNQLNVGSIHDSYKSFLAIQDEGFKVSYGKIKEIISKEFNHKDIFKVSYFFLAFKSFLNQNENNLLGVEKDIQQLKSTDAEVAAFVVAMLGYTFSFEQLYESLHIFNNAPLFKAPLKPYQKLIENNESQLIRDSDKSRIDESGSEERDPEIMKIISDSNTGSNEIITENIDTEKYNSEIVGLHSEHDICEEPINAKEPKILIEKTPNLTSENKDSLKNRKVGPQVKKAAKVKPTPSSASSEKLFRDLFDQQDSSLKSDKGLYNEIDLSKIVKLAKDRQVFRELKDEKTFEGAIMGYLPNSCSQNDLFKEIEIIQKDLRLSQEVVDQLRSIITKIKE